jgi:hypothetical protein
MHASACRAPALAPSALPSLGTGSAGLGPFDVDINPGGPDLECPPGSCQLICITDETHKAKNTVCSRLTHVIRHLTTPRIPQGGAQLVPVPVSPGLYLAPTPLCPSLPTSCTPTPVRWTAPTLLIHHAPVLLSLAKEDATIRKAPIHPANPLPAQPKHTPRRPTQQEDEDTLPPPTSRRKTQTDPFSQTTEHQQRHKPNPVPPPPKSRRGLALRNAAPPPCRPNPPELSRACRGEQRKGRLCP